MSTVAKAAHEETVPPLGRSNRHTHRLLMEVWDEMMAQDCKWGEQNHPDLPRPYGIADNHLLLGVPSADGARDNCEAWHRAEVGTWAHILIEEVCEAIDAPTEADLRTELVQCAAVIVQWIKAIDRRAS